MKKRIVDNKGMTIMEVLISVCIISIVLILLFSLLLQVRSEDRDNSIQSNFILHQSVMIKSIEEDIIDYGLLSISECNLKDVLNEKDLVGVVEKEKGETVGNYCVKFIFGKSQDDQKFSNNVGYLLLYKYKLKWKVNDGEVVEDTEATNGQPWMIRYQKGYLNNDPNIIFSSNSKSNRFVEQSSVMKELPAPIKIKDNSPYVRYTTNAGNNSALFVMPIVTESDEHYDIDVSFTYSLSYDPSDPINDNFSCNYLNKENFCIESGSNSLKNKLYNVKVKLEDDGTEYYIAPYPFTNGEITPETIRTPDVWSKVHSYITEYLEFKYEMRDISLEGSDIIVHVNSAQK